MTIRTIIISLLLACLPGGSIRAADVSTGFNITAASGLIQRLLPQQAKQFVVETIAPENGSDVFEIESRDGKIVLRGDNGVAVASALNRYLKEYCHCDISWDCGATEKEKDRFELDARELITTWTSSDSIPDYANRQWNGLLGEFYFHRWQMWLDELNNSLAKGTMLDEAAVRGRIRDWEIAWTRKTDRFSTQPKGDVVAISHKLFTTYAADASAPLAAEKN